MTRSPLPSGTSIGPAEGGLDAVTVHTPLCHGRIYLHGATVTSWRPAGEEDDVLFLAGRSRFEPDSAIRGGVPLCAPWFGPGRDNDKEPSHGFLRVAPWSLMSVSAGPDGAISVALGLSGDAYADLPGAQDYPTDVRFDYTVTFGHDLSLSLRTTAGATDVPHEEALHTYVRVGDVRAARLEGLAGAAYVDKTDKGAVKIQAGSLVLSGETDRVFTATAPVSVVDDRLGRTVEVTGTGHGNTVVWNPWAEKGPALADLGEEWPDFVCVESANVLDRSLTVAAGTSHMIGQRIALH